MIALSAAVQLRPTPQPQFAGKQPHHRPHWKFKLHPRLPQPASVSFNPLGTGQRDPVVSNPRDRAAQPDPAIIPQMSTTSTTPIPEATVAPSTATNTRSSDDAMPIPPAVLLVLTVALATVLCMCTLWCIRRCGRTPTEPYEDEYEAIEAAGYRPYARNGGNSPVMTQTNRPPTANSRHSMLDPSPVVGHQMLEDDDHEDIFLHMHSPNRGPRYTRPRSFPDWHPDWQHHPRDRPSRRQGGRTPLPVYSVIMSPLTAAHTAELLQRELELVHQAREAGIVLRGPPTYDEAVGTSIGSVDGDDDDDGLVFPQAAAAAAAASAAASPGSEQDLGDGALYQPPTVRNFAAVARAVLVRSTSLRIPAPPPPSSASSIASYHSDSDSDDDDANGGQGRFEPRPPSLSQHPSPRPTSAPTESSPLAQSLTIATDVQVPAHPS
ncbi:hypothetical protein BCR44DRAFT_48195, partial [Catenaria anguillulae PL171]